MERMSGVYEAQLLQSPDQLVQPVIESQAAASAHNPKYSSTGPYRLVKDV